MLVIAVALFAATVVGSLVFGYAAAYHRKPGVSHFRAALVTNLLQNPSLYTDSGREARRWFLACYYGAMAIGIAITCVVMYRRFAG